MLLSSVVVLQVLGGHTLLGLSVCGFRGHVIMMTRQCIEMCVHSFHTFSYAA